MQIILLIYNVTLLHSLNVYFPFILNCWSNPLLLRPVVFFVFPLLRITRISNPARPGRAKPLATSVSPVIPLWAISHAWQGTVLFLGHLCHAVKNSALDRWGMCPIRSLLAYPKRAFQGWLVVIRKAGNYQTRLMTLRMCVYSSPFMWGWVRFMFDKDVLEICWVDWCPEPAGDRFWGTWSAWMKTSHGLEAQLSVQARKEEKMQCRRFMASSKLQILEAFSCLNRPCHSVMSREVAWLLISKLWVSSYSIMVVVVMRDLGAFVVKPECTLHITLHSLHTSIVFVCSHRLLHHPTGRALGFSGLAS